MKKLLATSLISILALSATPAKADIVGTYLKATVIQALENEADFSTMDFQNADFDEATAFSGALGFGLAMARAELELIYNKIDGDGKDFEVEQLSWYANAYLDLPTIIILEPYIGAGIGQTKFDFEDISNNTSDMEFTYQLMAGVNFEITDGIVLNAGYRFQDNSEPELNLNSASDFVDNSSHSIEIGVRFGF